MKVTILGSGTCVPSIKRSSPAVLISSQNSSVLLDCGPGTIRQLANADVDFNRIEAIVLSHFHIDHIADLVPFVFSSNYHPDLPRTVPLKVIAPPGIESLFQQLVSAYGEQLQPEKYNIDFIESRGSETGLSQFTVRTREVPHGLGSMAIKLSNPNGQNLVYSGDTDYSNALIDLARFCDLLILECAYPDDFKKPGHLTPSDAARIAKQACPGKLVLTHFYPVCEDYDILSAVRKLYSGDVLMAEDLLEINI